MIACSSCGFELTDDSAFCSRCGTKLAAPRALPEERKTVTTLICDLVGFTAMSERADPEEIDAMLRRYGEAARAAIEDHGGVVEKFIGDAVVGVFGVPAVREDDAERAVRAGLDVVKALEGQSRPDGGPLQARVGVNTGKVLLRLDVSPESGENFLTGDAVNTAARLQSAAPPMGVVVGALTHRLTADAFAYEPLPALTLKGKSGRVSAWIAQEMVTSGAARADAGLSSPMVGRESEQAVFARAIDRLGEGRGGLVFVTGEAGIGKTRLVEEARAAAGQLNCSWLEGRTLSFGRTISYWPFFEIIQQDAGIDSDDGEAERWAKLAARVTALFGEQTPEVLPYLASLLSYPVPEEFAERVRHLDGEAMGRQVYRASRLYFGRLAEERPLVVVFEDVHWLDGSSAALLEHLLPLTEKVPLLLCCVARPETNTPLGALQALGRESYAERLTEIALWPLSADESTTLVCNLARLDGLPGTLRAAILEKAEGNPFFVEEIVRSLIDLGGLVAESRGHYRVTERAGRIDIPDTLQGVIMARVDRLDDQLKEVLRLASVIGRSFFYRVLVAVDEADRELDSSLLGLQARELIRERARDPELEYIFKHALVQEATYESILLLRRRNLHRKVAEAIETLFSERLEDFHSLLSYHYSKAEDWEKAQEYLFKAGDQAGKIAADAEALEHYEQAMQAYALAFGDRWDSLERAVLERKMGEALLRRGEHGRAWEYFRRALADLGHPFPISTWAVRRAVVVQALIQLGRRLVPWSRRRLPSPVLVRVAEERFSINYSTAIMEAGSSQLQAALAVLCALNVAESARLEWATAAALVAMGYLCDLIPLPRVAHFYYRRSLAMAEELRDPYALGAAHIGMGWHQYWATGEWPTALDHLARARDFFRTGRGRDWGSATTEMADLTLDRGEFAESLTYAEEAVAFGAESGDHVVEGWAQLRVGAILSARGALGEAEEHLRTGITALLVSQPADAVMGAGWLAAALLRQEKAEEARALLGEQRERIRGYGVRGYYLRPYHNAWGMLCLTEAEHAQGAARTAALKEARAACRAMRRTATADIGGTVAAFRLQGVYHWLRGRPTKAQAWWRKSLATAERLGMRYEGALTELEMGRRLDDRALLEKAAATFADTGAQFDVAQARELIGNPHQELASGTAS
jgi:class 3 adenylate cyclase/tetratricopeptide (TPR) repeat protein